MVQFWQNLDALLNPLHCLEYRVKEQGRHKIFQGNQECFGQKSQRYTKGIDIAITQIGAGKKWINLSLF